MCGLYDCNQESGYKEGFQEMAEVLEVFELGKHPQHVAESQHGVGLPLISVSATSLGSWHSPIISTVKQE